MNKNTTSPTQDFDGTPYDPDDPDSVSDFWEGAVITEKGKVIGTAKRPGERGRQKKPTKKPVSIRLSPEVIAHFKGQGKGWQSKIDQVLRDYVHKYANKTL